MLSAVLVGSAVAGPTPACADNTNPLIELIDTAAQRLQIAEPVAAFKWKTQTPIEDPTRVREQLAALAAEAVAEDVDPDYVTRVFADQIAATEALEYDRFAQWKLDPSGAPSTA
ncbi:MAG TPA: gamma subclass chorismate mutase AroQ, partial [Mycobacterium sp.]|nr:gamma subclass chorismate mutase AroQ [Mycobacterium sp.]